MDDFLVDSQNLIRYLMRRKALLLVGAICLLPTAWCRQQQLLREGAFLQRRIEILVLTLVARILRLHAHTGVHQKRIRTTGQR